MQHWCYKMGEHYKHYAKLKKSVLRNYVIWFYLYETSGQGECTETESKLVTA